MAIDGDRSRRSSPALADTVDLLCRIAAWIVVVALVFAVGIRTAHRFDAWYLTGSIVREDTRSRCPIDITSVSTGALDPQC